MEWDTQRETIYKSNTPLLAGVQQRLQECLLPLSLNDVDTELGGELGDPLTLHHLSEDLSN